MSVINQIQVGSTTYDIQDAAAVPSSRTINGKALSSNISLSASDVGAMPSTYTAPVTSVNGNTGAVVLSIPSTASDVGAVPTSRTVNGKALSSNITLSAADVGALPSTYTAPVTSVNGSTGAVTIAIPSTAADVGAVPMPTGGGDLAADVYVPTVNASNEWYKATATTTPGSYKIAKYESSGYLKSTTPSASDNSTKVATTAYVQTALASAGGASEWGQLTGTLSNQTDLQAALDSKVAKSGDTMSGNLSVSKSSAPEILVKDSTNNNLAASLLVDSGHQNHGLYSNGYASASDSFTSDSKWIIYRGSDGEAHSELKIFGAVWNDYAEYRKTIDVKPGTCVHEKGDGSLEPSTDFLQYGCEIISDTYGFAIGENDECKTPIAVSGRVLAYLYQDREEALKHIGWPVCSGPNGTVSIMSEEEQRLYPLRAIGTISEVPNYDYWGSGNVKVDGRVWIRLR